MERQVYEHSDGVGTHDVLHLDLAATPRAASEARRALHAFLEGTDYEPRAEDAALALSELVTNAVLHGREPLALRLVLRADRLRAEVRDGSPLTPSFSMLDPAAVTGRGLLLVANLADRWGLEPVAGGGKAVWFELDREAVPSAELGIDELLASWGEDVEDPAQEVVKVVLTELDVALTARSEAHVEALLRELALVAGCDTAEEPDPALALVAERVVQAANAVEALRSEMKHQLSRAVVEGSDAGRRRAAGHPRRRRHRPQPSPAPSTTPTGSPGGAQLLTQPAPYVAVRGPRALPAARRRPAQRLAARYSAEPSAGARAARPPGAGGPAGAAGRRRAPRRPRRRPPAGPRARRRTARTGRARSTARARPARTRSRSTPTSRSSPRRSTRPSV